MKKKRFFIIMIGLIISIALLVGGCGAKENEDVGNDDEEIIIGDEDEDKDSGLAEQGSSDEDGGDEYPYDIEIGKLAPNFTLENLDGQEVSLEDYRGKIVMLNFWASWCPPCRQEMPDMKRLQEENEDLVIFAVNVKEEKSKVESFIEEGGYGFEVALDPEGEIAAIYLVSAFPTSYFIDKEGILLGGVPGMLEYPQMVQILEGIREEQ